MEIKAAEFIKRSMEMSQLPPADLPEYAFVGRSNVGKSSWINTLCRRKGLAHISATPGKTQAIHHYLIDQKWYLVDLPGYGYAKVAQTQRKVFHKLIEDYVLDRPTLQCVFVLVDSRIKPQQLDLDFIQFLGENEIPVVILFTKTDKTGINSQAVHRNAFEKALLETWEDLPPRFQTSSLNGKGRDEVLELIATTNEGYFNME